MWWWRNADFGGSATVVNQPYKDERPKDTPFRKSQNYQLSTQLALKYHSCFLLNITQRLTPSLLYGNEGQFDGTWYVHPDTHVHALPVSMMLMLAKD